MLEKVYDSYLEENNFNDLLTDILLGVSGACIAILLGHQIRNYKRNNYMEYEEEIYYEYPLKQEEEK